MVSLFSEQIAPLNFMELASNHAINLLEKAKGILAAFDAFILPQPKYPELTKEDVALCLQYESEYHKVYGFYCETMKIMEQQETQYHELIEGKTFPFSEKAFGYFSMDDKVKDAIYDLSEKLIDTIFSHFTKTYGIDLKEQKKSLTTELLGEKYKRSSGKEKKLKLHFDMLYTSIKEHLAGRTFSEVAEEKTMEEFRSAIRESNYDASSRHFVYNGALKLVCENDKVIYQSGRNLGIGQSYFKGDGCLEGFFLGLSKYESGKAELLECFKGLCKWDGCKIIYNVVTSIEGSGMVKTIEIYKKGKFEIVFHNAESARGFVEFCREF